MVATEQAEWLKECGAFSVQTWRDLRVTGGPGQEGKNFLLNFLSIAHSAASVLAQTGRLSRARKTELLDILYRELGSQTVGQAVYVDTLAQKHFL